MKATQAWALGAACTHENKFGYRNIGANCDWRNRAEIDMMRITNGIMLQSISSGN